jgi:hypothetical protein
MNFLELRHGEVRSTPLFRTQVDNARLGCQVEKFGVLLVEGGAERLELARPQSGMRARLHNGTGALASMHNCMNT